MAAGCGAADTADTDEDVGPAAVWHSQMTCCGVGGTRLRHLRRPPLVRRLVLLVRVQVPAAGTAAAPASWATIGVGLVVQG